MYVNIDNVGRPLVGIQGRITENAGRPLVGIQGRINKNLHFRIGEPQGPSLHFLTTELLNKILVFFSVFLSAKFVDKKTYNMYGKHYYRRVKFILQIGDLFFLNLAFIVASLITTSNPHYLPSEQTVIFLTMINVMWVVLSHIISNLYQIRRHILIAKKTIIAAIIISLHYLVVSFILKTSDTFDYDPQRIIYFYVFTYCLILTCKIVLYKKLKYFHKPDHTLHTIIMSRNRESECRNRIQHTN